MSSSALEEDFAESDNLAAAEDEESSIDLESAIEGEDIGGLTVDASAEGWEVESLSGTVLEEGGGDF